ncbi:MAG: DUF1501 domain-containing protein [Pirellulales bacterium]|nr:DUF1501 domain-containing protein [Pirellulales bacterium]
MRVKNCDGVTRRDALRVGGLTALSLSLPGLLRLRSGHAAKSVPGASAKAKNCILIWLDGGPSHLDMFDPKPNAPAEVRGPFETLQTNVPGVSFSELMPECGKRADRLAVVRSMTSPLGEHNFGTHYLLSGYRPTPVLEYPAFGCVAAHLRPTSGMLPDHIAVPNFRVGGANFSGNGFLSTTVQPFAIGGDPAKPDFSVRDLDRFPDVTAKRLNRRRKFLAAVDGFQQAVEQQAADVNLDPQFEQAFRLATSPEAKSAFDLQAEDARTRAAYGPRTIGQSCLLARRLIERGVPIVTVNNPGWDTHQQLYTRLKEGFAGARTPVGLVPSLDRALGALLDDLDERGLLEETLVVVMGEFGRTPKLNTSGGRDHWPRVFSVALAGGGISGGQIIGASDAVGESPAERPVSPADLTATIYTLLGIDPGTELHTPDGRPVRLVQDGTAIEELL